MVCASMAPFLAGALTRSAGLLLYWLIVRKARTCGTVARNCDARLDPRFSRESSLGFDYGAVKGEAIDGRGAKSGSASVLVLPANEAIVFDRIISSAAWSSSVARYGTIPISSAPSSSRQPKSSLECTRCSITQQCDSAPKFEVPAVGCGRCLLERPHLVSVPLPFVLGPCGECPNR